MRGLVRGTGFSARSMIFNCPTAKASLLGFDQAPNGQSL